MFKKYFKKKPRTAPQVHTAQEKAQASAGVTRTDGFVEGMWIPSLWVSAFTGFGLQPWAFAAPCFSMLTNA